MRNIFYSLIIASFIIPSLSMEKEKPNTETILSALAQCSLDVESNIITGTATFLNEKDRGNFRCVCTTYNGYIKVKMRGLIKAYKRNINSLLQCNTIFDLKAEHFDFFRHMRDFFPSIFNQPIERDLTALHKAILDDNDVASMFLLALDVNTDISAQVPDIQNPKATKEQTCIELLEEKKKPYWIEHFIVRSRKDRLWKIITYANYSVVTDKIYYVVDLLVNPWPTVSLFKYFWDKALYEPGEQTTTYQYLNLCIDAGDILLNQHHFTQRCDSGYLLAIIANEHLRDVVFSRKVISKDMIKTMIRLLMHQIFTPNGSNHDIENLGWVLERGSAYVHSKANDPTRKYDQSVWDILLPLVTNISSDASSLLQMRKIESVMQLLLAAGADPYEDMMPILSEVTEVPITSLLLDASFSQTNSEASFIVRLLDMCHKSKFNREVYVQWARFGNWLTSSQFCKHMMEVGIDPLMKCGQYGIPFEYALSLSNNKQRAELCSIMLPFCEEQLKDREIPQCDFDQLYNNFEFYMGLINAGMTCKPWAYKYIKKWIEKPHLLKRLVESNQIEPLSEYYKGLKPIKGRYSSFNPIQSALDAYTHNDADPAVFESLTIMIEHCRGQLMSNPIVLHSPQIYMLKRGNKLDYLLQNGFTLPTTSPKSLETNQSFFYLTFMIFFIITHING